MAEGRPRPSHDEVLEVIARHLTERGTPRERVTLDASFIRDLETDSLQLQTLAHTLEDEFGVVMEPRDTVELETVGAAVRYVASGAAARA